MRKLSWEDEARKYLSCEEPLTKYCKKRHLSYSTMYYWVRRLRGTATELPPSFVEVTSLPRQQEQSTVEYRIVLGNGRRIEVGAGFYAAVLASMVRVCESC